jgi:hypothetical protein
MSEKPAVRKTRIVKKRVPKVKPEPQLVCDEELCRVVMPELEQELEPEPLPKEPAHVKFISSPESSTTEVGDSEGLEAEPVVAAPAKSKRRQQTKYSKEELSELYDLLLDSFDSRLSEENIDPQQKKFLRNTKKSLKDLKSGTLKTIKKPKKEKDAEGTVKPPSGLTKPVLISDEMMEFIGSDTNKRSRVDITRALCAYVREHDLQNPANRKEILPDAKLAKLLAHDPEVHGPLTYCSIQVLVQRHFPN